MLDHMLFESAYWMRKTNDVASKLANYNNLRNQVNSLQSQVDSLDSFKRNVFDSISNINSRKNLSIRHSGSGKNWSADATIEVNHYGDVTVK